MRIESIQIDGFGIYRERKLTGFKPGINVIYGANEAGKTTLLELVRRILFGFPDGRSRENRYQLTPDAPLGGSLFCRLQNGEEIVIRRSGGPRGGELKVETASGILTGPGALDGLLRLSPEFFRNVYAFSLDEMQKIDSLDSDEIKGRIYGAGMGLGATSPAAVKKYFSDAAAVFFKERGSSQLQPSLCRQLDELRQQLRECRRELPHYDQLVSEMSALEKESHATEAGINHSRNELRRLELHRKLYDDGIDLTAIRQRISSLPPATLSDDVLNRLERLKAAIAQARETASAAEIEQQDIDNQLTDLRINAELLPQAGPLAALLRQVSLYESARTELPELKRQIDDFDHRINQQLALLSGIFTRAQAESFQLDIFQTERATALRNTIRKADDDLQRLEAQLRSENETRRRLGLENASAKASRNAVIFPLILLCSGIAAGIIAVKYSWPVGIATGMAGLLAAMWFGITLRRQPLPQNAEDKAIAAELADARRNSECAWQQWRLLLAELRWPETVKPENFTDLTTRLERIAESADTVSDLIRKKGILENHLAEIEAEYHRLTPFLPEQSAELPLPAGTEVLSGMLRSEQEKQMRRDHLTAALDAARKKSVAARQRLDQTEDELKQFLHSCRADNEESLRQMAGQMQERRRLETELDGRLRQFQKDSGAGAEFEALLEKLSGADPAALENEIAVLRKLMEEDEQRYRQQLERLGMGKNQLTSLASHETMLRLRQQEETTIGQLNTAAGSWAVNIAALRIFEAALAEYERERQPEVLRQAGALMARITDGRYTSIYRPIDGDDLLVRTAEGKTLPIAVLSRGTREELYLSMRLGLIAEYELAGTEPLPLIMDDVLVNFDDARRREAIAALAGFAAERQILVMTCHRRTAEDYLAAGGSAFDLTGTTAN